MKHKINTINLEYDVCLKFKNILEKHDIEFETTLLLNEHGIPKITNHEGRMMVMIKTIHFEKYVYDMIEFKLKYL